MPAFHMQTALDRVWAEPDSTLALLLRRAEELFAARGFEGVTTRDISAAAGVNVSTLHFHWKNKLTLFEAVCRNHDRYFVRYMQRMAKDAQQQALSLEEQIDRYVDWSVDFLAEHPAAARIGLQYLSSGGPLAEDVPFLLHNATAFRLAGAEVARRLSPEVETQTDVMLLVQFVLFGGMAIFADTPLQRELMGGSVYRSPELRDRIKRYGSFLLRRLLGASGPTRTSEGEGT